MEDARLLVARALTLVEDESHEAGRLAVRAGMYLGRMSRDYEGAQESFGRSLRIARREGDVDLELLALAIWPRSTCSISSLSNAKGTCGRRLKRPAELIICRPKSKRINVPYCLDCYRQY